MMLQSVLRCEANPFGADFNWCPVKNAFEEVAADSYVPLTKATDDTQVIDHTRVNCNEDHH